MKFNSFQRFLSKLGPFQWSLHNLIAHPMMEILHWIRLHKTSRWLHDITMPSSHTHEEDNVKQQET